MTRATVWPALWLMLGLSFIGGWAALGAGCGSGSANPGSGGAAGPTGSGGSPGSGGGGGGGGGGGKPATGSGGARATGGAAGTGGNGAGGTPPGGGTGGSAAQSLCAAGMTYGSPLPTNIVVNAIGAPTEPPANYFAFIEGPVWIASLQTLFFSDNASSPQERIFKLVPPAMTPQLFMEPSGSNGLAVDRNGKLVVADQRNQRITRVDPMTGMTLEVIVPAGSFKPNDVVVRGDDNVYFTDPDSGFYRASPGGGLSPPFTLLIRPNGIALSPDGNSLYVGAMGNKQIHRFKLAADGAVDASSDTILATTTNDTADGMCVDCAGNVYIGTGGGIEVFSASGASIGLVPTGESSNCTFGGADQRTIYVTSRALLKSAILNVPGLPD